MARTTRVYGRERRRPTFITFSNGGRSVARRHNIDDILFYTHLVKKTFDVVNKEDEID